MCGCETRLTDSRRQLGQRTARPTAPVRRRQQRERGREDRSWLVLGVAEEAPRPLPTPDPRRRELAELAAGGLEPRSHQVEELAGVEAERRPVEVVVGDEAVVLLATAAVEPDAEDRGMRGSRELLDAAEGGEQHVGLAPYGTGKGVAARERVVHADVVETTPDGDPGVLST